MVLALFERRLRRLALADSRLNSRFDAASSTVRWLNISMIFSDDGGLARGAMPGLFNRGDRLGEKNARLLDERGAFVGRACPATIR
jgi:hypothetical protein